VSAVENGWHLDPSAADGPHRRIAEALSAAHGAGLHRDPDLIEDAYWRQLARVLADHDTCTGTPACSDLYGRARYVLEQGWAVNPDASPDAYRVLAQQLQILLHKPRQEHDDVVWQTLSDAVHDIVH
jgi:hypothetical protein